LNSSTTMAWHPTSLYDEPHAKRIDPLPTMNEGFGKQYSPQNYSVF